MSPFIPFLLLFLLFILIIIIDRSEHRQTGAMTPYLSDCCIYQPSMKLMVNPSGKCEFHPMKWIIKAEFPTYMWVYKYDHFCFFRHSTQRNYSLCQRLEKYSHGWRLQKSESLYNSDLEFGNWSHITDDKMYLWHEIWIHQKLLSWIVTDCHIALDFSMCGCSVIYHC